MQDFFSHCIRSWVRAVTAQFWKVKTSLEGESCILFTQHLPNLTFGTTIFFSEPHCHVWHCFLSGDSVRLTFSSYSSGLSGYPRSGDRVYNTHWSLGPQADGPSRQQRASNLGLQLELLGESICLCTGVSNKVRFGIQLSLHYHTGCAYLRTKLTQWRAQFRGGGRNLDPKLYITHVWTFYLL